MLENDSKPTKSLALLKFEMMYDLPFLVGQSNLAISCVILEFVASASINKTR